MNQIWTTPLPWYFFRLTTPLLHVPPPHHRTNHDRLVKEVAYYNKETAENETQLLAMKEQNKNPHDVKKFGEVVEESRMMIPDSRRRLDQALTDLEAYLSSPSVQGRVEATNEWYTKAQAVLNEQGYPPMGSKTAAGGDDVVDETNLDDLKEGEAF